ncbi:MAG: helix-turn-helix domain-containing protein [Actinomycetota bacterium]|nr:helix-turn-helix domain-containing protein [Actinomycetota bacterium]
MGIAADLIREARQAAGLTQGELARRARTSQSAVAAYESGAKVPTSETLDRLLRETGVSIRTQPLTPKNGRAAALSILLRDHRDEILDIAERNGASNVRVFGSVARGEEHPGSDLDLLVDLGPGRSLLDQVRLRRALTELLHAEIDVLTSGGLLDRDIAILKEAVPI